MQVKKYLWEVNYFFKRLWIDTKEFFDNIKRIFVFMPIVWRTRNWDYEYSVDLFIFGLIYLRDGIDVYNGPEKKRIKEEIDQFLFMYQQMEDDILFEDYLKKLKRLGTSLDNSAERSKLFDEYTIKSEKLRDEVWDFLKTHMHTWWN